MRTDSEPAIVVSHEWRVPRLAGRAWRLLDAEMARERSLANWATRSMAARISSFCRVATGVWSLGSARSKSGKVPVSLRGLETTLEHRA